MALCVIKRTAFAYGSGWEAHIVFLFSFFLFAHILFALFPSSSRGSGRHCQHSAGEVISSCALQGSAAFCVSTSSFFLMHFGARFQTSAGDWRGCGVFRKAMTTHGNFLSGCKLSNSCVRRRGPAATVAGARLGIEGWAEKVCTGGMEGLGLEGHVALVFSVHSATNCGHWQRWQQASTRPVSDRIALCCSSAV